MKSTSYWREGKVFSADYAGGTPSGGGDVAAETKADGEVGRIAIPAGWHARARFEIDPDQCRRARDFAFGEWPR